MTLKGRKVTHVLPSGKKGKYGYGTIVDVIEKDSTTRVYVKFDDVEDIKTFSYPECFGRYLKLEDSELAEHVEEVKMAYMKGVENCRKQQSERPSSQNSVIESPDSILAELDSMIGLEDVKKDVRRLTSFIQINNLRKDRGFRTPVISKHLVLTGNPGTGKTTVARLISRIYYSIGAISENKIVETSRSGLVAGYVGQTALKTQKVIQDALGGVLFIDEAYSLVSHSKNDYGSEAIDTLLSAMENNRDNLVVIVAGYEEPMKEFIKMNSGLASRFNRYLHFEDYNSDDLMSIFQKLCEENEYILQEKAEERIHDYLDSVYKNREKEFGNARTVRNIFEKVITYQAERVINMHYIDDEALTELNINDVENAISQAA